jgi:hypothetical protein
LAALAAPPLLLAGWLLISPDMVYSREMTGDLLFNLEGAWHLYNGQTAHVDFHDPLGSLPFFLTEIGFRLAGLGPKAFLAGTLLFAASIFTAAIFVVAPRLPVAAATMAIFYVTFLALVPINIGDDPSIYTFAMSYNRFGWSGLVLLFLLLTLAPVHDRWRNGGDPLVGLLLLVVLFYIKITYFLVGLGAVAGALYLSTHIRSASRAWLLVLGVAALIAAAPANFPYWRDIVATIMSGAVRGDALGLVKAVLINGAETSLLLVQLLCLLFLWRDRSLAGCTLAMALFAVIGGLFILSQNAQTGGVPLFVVISFLLVESFRHRWLRLSFRHESGALLLLLAGVTPIALSVVSMSISIAGYWTKATQMSGTMLVDESHLRGLAVPAGSAGLLEAFSQGTVSPQTLIAVRREHPRWELTQAEYLETILDAIAVFRDYADRHSGVAPKIMLFDAVDPLPFALGFAPPRGSDLWFDPVFPWPPAEQALADVDFVLVPKFFSTTTEMAVARYGRYLHDHFAAVRETMSWMVYRRAATQSASGND